MAISSHRAIPTLLVWWMKPSLIKCTASMVFRCPWCLIEILFSLVHFGENCSVKRVDQNKHVNQQVEGYLRCFINVHPHRWSKWLSLCELWYNSNWHSSTSRSPLK